jgi:hypothetical protein
VPPGDRQPADGQAVELDRVVPPSGNLWLAGQQIWLGPAMTGRTIRLWAGRDRVHVLLDGYRVKTLPSRLDARDLARLAAAGARQAGPPPLPTASGDVIEVERTVNASGNVRQKMSCGAQSANTGRGHRRPTPRDSSKGPWSAAPQPRWACPTLSQQTWECSGMRARPCPY